MHIEPSVVDGAKIVLSYATAAGAFGYSAKLAWDTVRTDGVSAFALRTLASTLLVFGFFELLPHHPVGVSEVHLILGATLYLIFGAGPAAIGLAAGLLVQGLFFAPADLPQFAMNVTTLLVPLFAVSYMARRVIPEKTPYKNVSYAQALKLSATFQGGIVAWVAFWSVYGQGLGSESLMQIGAFGAAYLAVIVIEPLIDVAILAGAKSASQLKKTSLVQPRLYNAAV
jgi:ABC-type Co2+ transport system permease subunit